MEGCDKDARYKCSMDTGQVLCLCKSHTKKFFEAGLETMKRYNRAIYIQKWSAGG